MSLDVDTKNELLEQVCYLCDRADRSFRRGQQMDADQRRIGLDWQYRTEGDAFEHSAVCLLITICRLDGDSWWLYEALNREWNAVKEVERSAAV